MSAQATLEAAFRDAAARLQPGTAGLPRSADVLRSWLVIHRVRKHLSWLEAAEQLVDAAEPTPAWLAVLCDGWVVRASGGFRGAAEALLPRLPDSPDAVAALLRYWRITGRPDAFDRARALVPTAPTTPDEAAANYALWCATADVEQRRLATDALDGLSFADLPFRHWAMLADLRDLPRGPQDAADAVATRPLSDAADAAARVQPLAALTLPVLQVEVRWWLESELQEGPMSEAATFAWPAVRLRFARLTVRDQIRFGAHLDGDDRGELEDAGVVGPWMESLVEELDLGGLIGEVQRRRRSPSRMRRR